MIWLVVFRLASELTSKKTARRGFRRASRVSVMQDGTYSAVWRMFGTFLLVATTAHARDVVIRSDPGGLVAEYAMEFAAVDRRGDRIVIDGTCLSACTMALAIPTTCVTKRAVLGFHTPYQRGEFGTISLEAAQFLWDHYPRPIREWLRDHGGLSPHLKYLKGNALRRLVPSC